VADKNVIQIQVNGKDDELAAPATLASLIERRQPRPPFAVEVNKQLVKAAQYKETALREGDRVEIVTLVGGG